jgi:2,4-dienoyl-CoA reductase (NADPH2)
VHLFEASDSLGGQFNLARRIPGKEEYGETIRYFTAELARLNVQVHLSTPVDEVILGRETWDEIILACGVTPRLPDIPGITHPMVMTYDQVIRGERVPGDCVAVIGAGGIGVDVATFLTTPTTDVKAYLEAWGVDPTRRQPGGLTKPLPAQPLRKVYLLYRSKGKYGASLGKTTGWIHRLHLRHMAVDPVPEVQYVRIDDQGLHTLVKGAPRCFEVDSVVLCAGQEPNNQLKTLAQTYCTRVHLIGGALRAGELDAQRAIEEGTRLGMEI